MKPTRGRIVDYFRATDHNDNLEGFAAIITRAELKPSRKNVDDTEVPWPADDEKSYNCKVQIFGDLVHPLHDAQFSATPKAGHWSWPVRVDEKKAPETVIPNNAVSDSEAR